MSRTSKGFTLVELMIVIAIIAVIAAVALPNLLATRLAANEASAIATLRNLVTAQAQFQQQSCTSCWTSTWRPSVSSARLPVTAAPAGGSPRRCGSARP